MVCAGQTEYGSHEHASRFGLAGGLPGSSWPAPVMRQGDPGRHFAQPLQVTATGVGRHGTWAPNRLSRTMSPGARSVCSAASSRSIRSTYSRRSVSSSVSCSPANSGYRQYEGRLSDAAGCSTGELAKHRSRDAQCRYYESDAAAFGPGPWLASSPLAWASRTGGVPLRRSAGRSTADLGRTTAWAGNNRYHGMTPTGSLDGAGIRDTAALTGGTLRNNAFVDDVYCSTSSRGLR